MSMKEPDVQTPDALEHFDGRPDEFIGKICDHVDKHSLSQSEERQYYKKMARRVRLIMAGLSRVEAREWRTALNTLQYMR